MRHDFDAEFYPDQPDDIRAIVIATPADKISVPRGTPNIGVPRGTPTSTTADHFVLKINNEWRSAVPSILKVAQYCAEAQATLDGIERRKFYDGLPFNRSTCQKLACIAANEALYEPAIQQYLPPHWTVIHKLAHCSQEEIVRAIQEGVLHPKCARNCLEAWVKTNTVAGVEAAQLAAARASHRAAAKTAKYGAAHEALMEAFKASPLMKQWQQAPKVVRDMVMRTINAIR
jgi:hypothetical protein